jgi:hypothetical protein
MTNWNKKIRKTNYYKENQEANHEKFLKKYLPLMQYRFQKMIKEKLKNAESKTF